MRKKELELAKLEPYKAEMQQDTHTQGPLEAWQLVVNAGLGSRWEENVGQMSGIAASAGGRECLTLSRFGRTPTHHNGSTDGHPGPG